MDIAIERDGDVVIVIATGVVDGSNAVKFREKIEAVIEESDRGAILDLNGVPHSASAGLRVILDLAKQLQRQHGKLIVCGLSGLVNDEFSISGFDRIIEVAADREAARGMV